jgi:nitrite reductase/ring-hydroxylating ferredoxin subunit
MQRVELAGIPVLLYRDGDAIHAVSAVCTHRGAPLDEGSVADGCVECPWHGSAFRFVDGGIARGPATFPLTRYDVRVKGGIVQLRAPRDLD